MFRDCLECTLNDSGYQLHPEDCPHYAPDEETSVVDDDSRDYEAPQTRIVVDKKFCTNQIRRKR